MPTPNGFNKEKYLVFLLSGVFAIQAVMLGAGLMFCAQNGGIEKCPSVGDRFDTTFSVMIATTLALLTGSAVAAGAKKNE